MVNKQKQEIEEQKRKLAELQQKAAQAVARNPSGMPSFLLSSLMCMRETPP